MKRVELLSPAGSFEGLVGALNAGADAVYLAGSQFGARAYAKNFTEDELIEALDYAHIFHKKIYLTLNTLIRENEFHLIYDYLRPLYEHGLDGIIVQDLGVLRYLHRQFPLLELHASTQLTITGSEGAEWLKELNVVRVVPARELSLKELIQMKQKTGLEIETFVHGAICYCYSGQCLFSSLIGGRSGNRGRCAQPCRLPYQGQLKDTHYLSLKDMCTIEMLPELVEAGIDSFKIEGRMKRPEYTAGVTAIYRKYLDLYYNDPKAEYRVSRQDLSLLNQLYIRNERSDGYYHRQNGREMLTLHDPSYAGTQESVLEQIAEQYLKERKRMPVTASVYLTPGRKAQMQVICGACEITSYGGEVSMAQKQPLTNETVEKQIRKTGNTNFEIADLTITLDGNCFYSVKELNELRRAAFESLQEELLKPYLREVPTKQEQSKVASTLAKQNMLQTGTNQLNHQLNQQLNLNIEVNTIEQLRSLLQRMKKYPEETLHRVYLSFELLQLHAETIDELFEKAQADGASCERLERYIALPHVIRENTADRLQTFLEKLRDGSWQPDGFLLRSLEELKPIKALFPNAELITDANLYVWNVEAKNAVQEHITEQYTIPVELNHNEMRSLCTPQAELMIYGHLPLMISANCIKKTENRCDHTSQFTELTDRQHKKMVVQTVCSYCYNIIYNSVTFSLHQKWNEIQKQPIGSCRVSFLNETASQMQEILDYFTGKSRQLVLEEYTNGHYSRGVE